MRASKNSPQEIEIDLGRYELRRCGRRVRLERKPMELLLLLAQRKEQLVGREEILARIWGPELFIDGERGVNNAIRKIRTALGDHADRPQFVETVFGKGYRFIGPVRIIPSAQKLHVSARATAAPVLELPSQAQERFSSDHLAQAEFLQGYRMGRSTIQQLDTAIGHLVNAIARDPEFALAHAVLSQFCASKHDEFDASQSWMDKAEFHVRRAHELNPHLPEVHLAKAHILWGPSRNFQHLDAIAELRLALALDANLPNAHNRLGSIFAHIGLLKEAAEAYERGRDLDSQGRMSRGIAKVYLWDGQYDRARKHIELWQKEVPTNKYSLWFAPQPALLEGNLQEAEVLLDKACQTLPEEPLVISLRGIFYGMTGQTEEALRCVRQACESPHSFGHSHHTYYQIACIYATLGQKKASLEWLERAISTGFACWPFFQRDPALSNIRNQPKFELLMGSLQAKYGNAA